LLDHWYLLGHVQRRFAWYRIRDLFLGLNQTVQDMEMALALAAACEQTEAIWLTKLFAGRDAPTREQARRIFLNCEKDPSAVCFAGLLEGSDDEIHQAAALGDAFAQARVAWRMRGTDGFLCAKRSAAQGERDGFFALGHCLQHGDGCKIDFERAKESYLIAAELGHFDAMFCLASMLKKSDPQRYLWFGRAAVGVNALPFLIEMERQVRDVNCSSNVVFAIGRALKGNIDNEKTAIFGETHMFDSCIVSANQALGFYEFQLQACRKAVDSWTLVGIRNYVVKDIRKLIAHLVWDSRFEANF
jgi:hypothetical protein